MISSHSPVPLYNRHNSYRDQAFGQAPKTPTGQKAEKEEAEREMMMLFGITVKRVAGVCLV
ncbi:hypothetical protein [Ammoniphilus sp. 3BR4]|uniref:hypothetical protein n=1 Tax=Ammoniphilus sp. 3BR4 TaxID=3158265 RepID=UPI0034657753